MMNGMSKSFGFKYCHLNIFKLHKQAVNLTKQIGVPELSVC